MRDLEHQAGLEGVQPGEGGPQVGQERQLHSGVEHSRLVLDSRPAGRDHRSPAGGPRRPAARPPAAPAHSRVNTKYGTIFG